MIATSFLRLRYTWWPIHPILFLVWATYPMAVFANAFLIGWALRTIIQRLGGTSAYQRARILMVGVIAGDLLGGLVFLAHGSLYYALTGLPPEIYNIFPK